MPALSLEGLDTELTVSLPLQVKVDLRGLDFKGLVQAIGEAAAATCSELLGWTVRAIERRALEAPPDRWTNRGPRTRRVQVSWGTVPIRRTRVRDRITGARCRVMNFWRMVQGAGQRLVHQERDGVGEIRKEDSTPRAVRRVYREADGVWLRRQKARRRRRGSSPANLPTSALAPREPDHLLMYVGAE